MPVDGDSARLGSTNGTSSGPGPSSDAETRAGAGIDPSDAALDELRTQAFAAVGLDRPAVMAAPVAIFAVDPAGRVVSWNRAAEELFGWPAEQIVGSAVPFLPDGDDAGTAPPLVALLDGRPADQVVQRATHRDGGTLEVLTSATRLDDGHGGAAGAICFAVDVTAKREAARRLARAHEKWQHLLMNISDTVTILDGDGRVRETTGQLTQILGYDPGSWASTDVFGLLHPEDVDVAADTWKHLVANPGNEARQVLRTRHHDGHYEVIEFSAVSLLDDPVIDGVVLTSRNITPEAGTEALLHREAEVLELIACGAPLDQTLPAVSQLVEAHAGGSSAVLLLSEDARRLEVGSAGEVAAAFLEAAVGSSLVTSSRPSAFDLRRPFVVADYANDPRTAHQAAVAATAGIRAAWAQPIIDSRTDELLGVLATFLGEAREPTDAERAVADVACDLAGIAIERARWQRALRHQARHHQLTGLPNQGSIVEHLATTLADARPRQAAVAVMFIDLDRFKEVNDSLGHAAGDTLLTRFGRRLVNLVRPDDFVGHFGADEFIVILADADDEAVRFVANRLDLALSEPFGLDEGEIFLSASIGVAVSHDGSETAEALLQHADAAMFRAKDLGRDRMEVFDHEMRVRAGDQLRVDRDLRLALERDELEVHYQPEIDLRTGTVVGVEALVRWRHPTDGLLLPDGFIGVAEETGTIVPLGRRVLECAIGQAAAWAERLGDRAPRRLSVNLSGRQLNAPGLVDQLRRLLATSGWPPDQLVLELNESILIDDREATLDTLTELKSLGLQLAIDDFGTGFSSLNYLHRFPVDIVKIDRSFVVDLRPDGHGSPVASAILQMGHALGLRAVAEGVETDEQLAGLRHLGCDQAQGFLFAEARPADALEELLIDGRRW